MKKVLFALILLLLILPSVLATTQILYGNEGAMNTGATAYGGIIALDPNTSLGERHMMVSSDGNFTSMRVDLETDPGVGKDYNVTFLVNGVATDLECVVADTAVLCTSSAMVSVSAGDEVVYRIVPTGTPNASQAGISIKFIGDTAQEVLIPSGTSSPTNSSAIRYNSFGRGTSYTATEVDRQMLIATPGNLSDLYVKVPNALIGYDQYVWWLMVNGNPTALTCIIGWGGDTMTTCNDTVHNVAVSAGDLITIKVDPNSIPVGQGNNTYGITLTSTTDNESPLIAGEPALDTNNTHTTYHWIGGKNNWGSSWTTDETIRQTYVQESTLNKFYANATISPGLGNSYQLIVRLNGADTDLGCTISDAGTTCNDVSDLVVLNDGDVITLKVVPTSTPALTRLTWGLTSVVGQPQYDIDFNNFTTGTAVHLPVVVTMDCNGTAYDANYLSPYTIVDMNWGTYNCDYTADGWDTNNNIIFSVDGDKTIVIYHDQLFDASFSNPAPDPLDPENAINSINVAFTDTTTYAGLTGSAWEWLNESVQFAVTQNANDDFTSPGDYNICIDVDADDWNGNTVRDIQCNTILVKQYPQNVTFTPLLGVFGTAVNFNGMADGNITDWNWDFGGDGVSAIEDPSHDFSAPGDYNVCLKATAWNTLDRQTCLTVRIYGNASLVFVDETTHVGFQPQVFINDVNYSSWVAPDGSMDINFQLISGSTLTIRAWDATHSERSWFWDINMFTSIDINASLLTTNLGDNIDFVFYNQTDVKIPNTIIEVHRISWVADGQMASRKRTNSESEVSFFLNPIDCNYVFTINPGVSSYNYSSVTVTVNRPRDEETELDINGFDVSVSNIGAWEFSDQNFPVTFCIYGNTEGYYYVNVDHDDYDPRDYTARVTGDTATYTINPWLALAASGSDIAFITRNADNRETLSNILIQVWKWLPGSGNQLIESAQTDMTGVTSLNFILTNEYTINFYYEDLDHVWNLVYSGIYIPVATDTVYADLILEVVDFNYGSTNDIYAIFNPPGGTAFHSSPFDINVTVYGNGLTDVVVKTYWRGGVITNVHYGAVPSGTVITTNLDPDTWSAGYPVTIEVGLFYDGNVERIRLYKSYSPFDNSETNILTLLRTNVKNELDCPTDGSPCIGTIMIALIIVILVISSFASQVSRNKSSLAAIAFIIMGLFVYVDWIPWFWFVGLVVVGLFGFMLFRKGGLGHG